MHLNYGPYSKIFCDIQRFCVTFKENSCEPSLSRPLTGTPRLKTRCVTSISLKNTPWQHEISYFFECHRFFSLKFKVFLSNAPIFFQMHRFSRKNLIFKHPAAEDAMRHPYFPQKHAVTTRNSLHFLWNSKFFSIFFEIQSFSLNANLTYSLNVTDSLWMSKFFFEMPLFYFDILWNSKFS